MTTGEFTVSELITELQKYQPDKKVVFVRVETLPPEQVIEYPRCGIHKNGNVVEIRLFNSGGW